MGADLKRQLGLRASTALVIGEVVAIGIFLTPAGMAKSLASPALVLMVWIVMGAMALCGALSYGELASRYPEAGGGYAYLREAYGRPVAFLYGWMSLLVMDPGLTAALAVGLASYTGYLLELSAIEMKAVAVGSILLLAAVNIYGVKLGATLIQGLTVLKLGLLLFIVVWSFGFGFGDWSNFLPFFERRASADPLIPALAGGMVAAFFSFAGWWDVNKLAGEIHDPARNLPRALSYGVLLVALIYILTSAVFVYLVPLDRVTNGETFAAQAGEALFGPIGGSVFSTIVIIAILGSLAALLMASPRVYFAMAKDGLFFPAVAQVDPRFGTPARAIAVQAVLASILTTMGTFNEIVSYFIFIAVIFLALSIASVLVLPRSNRGDGAYRTPGYPWTPGIFLFLTALLLVLLGTGNPKQSALGVAVVAMGLPVYSFVIQPRQLQARASKENSDS